MSDNYIIATDLDRTLLPNGKQPYDNSMYLFRKFIESHKPMLIFVTGRNLKEVKSAIVKYDTPIPDYIVAEVGTKIYKKLREDKNWPEYITNITKNWDINKFKKSLMSIGSLRLQERSHQNALKLSYYLDDTSDSDRIMQLIKKIIKSISLDVEIIYSVDETNNLGLIDLLPKKATKLGALEYIRRQKKLTKKDIYYCGDSGNDILPLTNGYNAILVRNAINDVKKTVKAICQKKGYRLYIAKGYKKLNGYYVSGILEGLIKMGVLDSVS
ncbi:HAD-IIB family hydrolase [Candidatus Woesearchaeota archaeon]|nr:HAD-IIB family hydrolase [Candidatus Woesearchaeota archaeon]